MSRSALRIVVSFCAVVCFCSRPMVSKQDQAVAKQTKDISEVYPPTGKKIELQQKTKVEVLGQTLKKYVAALRRTPSKQVELVFLVDSSSSVGYENFYNELKFVKKLLADFTVSLNTTRVAVITFSSKDRVTKHLDHISNPSKFNHKCKLLEEQINSINYAGGGTYTYGAVIQAQQVLEHSRQGATKAVFLVTDGYSNGEDPRPAAKQLREDFGAEVFTFGIRNGNVRELLEMASEPQNEHSYILDSFEEFEALARRALHEDLHTGSYLLQSLSSCSRLCNDPVKGQQVSVESECCDDQAECTCGTHTGHYACLCAPGYYGNGLKGNCYPCPEGTYKWSSDPGDLTSCLPCPDMNQMSPPASTGPHLCTCKDGFATLNGKCKVVQCPTLLAPDHGYLVSGQCGTAYNAACGVRCEPGFKLVGSSIRLCGQDGLWQGEEASCHMRSCSELRPPRFGSMNCSDGTMYDSECLFSCLPGYSLIGSSRRRCLSVALWDGLPVYCRPVTCPGLPVPNNGSLNPARCTSGKSSYGDACHYACAQGFTLTGARLRKCQDQGQWSDWPRKKTKCIDTESPQLSCPQSVVVDAEEYQPSALVTWEVPEPLDNSGEAPTLLVVPAVFPPRRFPIGSHLVTYLAEDRSLNAAECNFTITVQDAQAPTVDQCESPSPFLTRSPPANVTWTEPVFSDNSGQVPEVRRSHWPGLFPYGDIPVTYTARDQAGNNSTCIITIIVREHACAPLTEPVNGVSTCVETEARVECRLRCSSGHAFVEPPDAYACSYEDGKWMPTDTFPDCSETELPNSIMQVGLVSIVPDKKDFGCNDYFLLDQLEKHLKRKLFRMITGICGNSVACSVEKTHTTCHKNREDLEEETNMVGRRRRGTPTGGRSKRAVGSKMVYVNASDLGSPKERVGLQFHLTVKGQLGTLTNESSWELASAVASASQFLESAALSGDLDLNMGSSRFRVEAVYFPERTVYLCEPGRILQENQCVKCPVGTFFNVTSERCESCPLGTYQFLEGQLSCLVCPQRTSTARGQSKSLGECKAQCLPGSFSPTGLEVCQTCEHGHFQTMYAQITCQACPEGKTTWRRGTRLLKDCNEVCPSGEVSRTGLLPCFTCPDGFFQPTQGERVCLRCPGAKPTGRRGANNINQCQGVDPETDSTVGAFRSRSEDDVLLVNDCFSMPCFHSATCEALEFGYVCHCAQGYKGVHCEVEVDECEWLKPCQHGGRCQDEVADYNCLCTQGYTGKDCQTEVNECAPEPCANGATCIDKLNGFTCKCAPGFTGPLCHINVNECVSKPCSNGGTCRDLVAAFACTCAPGFQGDTCETNVDDCASTPCMNNASCLDGVHSFSCECPSGFRGVLCEEDVNECSSNPCTNGATCRDGIATFLCLCPPAFTGELCETEMASDFHLKFAPKGALDMAIVESLRIDLSAFTLCLWINTQDRSNYGTPFSYATDLYDNALTLTDYSGFVLSVSQEKRVTDVMANDGGWHQMCATWRSQDGLWALYKDGYLADTGQGLAEGRTISGEGTAVLGQEQDGRGRNFSAQESYVGSLSSVHLWNHTMSSEEVLSLFAKCPHSGELRGNVLAWPDFLGGLRGDVVKLPSLFCQGCSEPVSPANGDVQVFPDRQPGGQAGYSCDQGYEIVGTATRSCTVHGGWSGLIPKCQRVSCGFPGTVLNGHFSGRATQFGDKVMYSCLPGFRLIGESTRQCQHDGKWSHPLPLCQEIICMLPSSMANGNILTKSKKIKARDQVILKCVEGYALDGPEKLTCTVEGQWDTDRWPLCQPRSCRSPPQVPNGILEGAVKTFTVGNLVSYKCLTGFILSGNGTIRCGVTSQWDDVVPRCERVTCGVPPEVLHSQVSSNNVVLRFGDTVKYVCTPGHQIFNVSEVTCQSHGSLSTPLPECRPIRCSELEAPLRGKIEATDFVFNTIVQYSCDVGYELQGPKSRKCRSSGDWSGEEPRCLPLKCSTPRAIANGRYSGDDHSVGNVVTYSCNQGYEVLGKPDIVCGQDGLWIHDTPLCEPVRCREPRLLTNGRWEASGWTFGHRLEYFCDEGHELVGSNSALCRENKRWEPLEGPLCRPVSCPPPPEIVGGNFLLSGAAIFSSTANYSCRVGFNMLGLSHLRCLSNGSWSLPWPTCQVVRCSHPLPIQHAYLVYADTSYRSAVEYYCEEGYKLEGSEVQVCGADGSWTNQQPICQRVKCPQPIPIQYGDVNVSDVIYGSEATYTCHKGHRMVGRHTRKCVQEGYWDGADPQCPPVTCLPLTPPDNGRTVGELGEYIPYLSVVEFTCDQGFYLEGEGTLECGEDAKWSSSQPRCLQVVCPVPPRAPSRGRLEGNDFSFGNTVKYICSEGHTLSGPSLILCLEDGTWSQNKDVTCSPVDCGPPNPLIDGLAQFQGTLFNNTVEYRCFEGFVLEGPGLLRCGPSGSWIGSGVPSCKRLTCSAPVPVDEESVVCEESLAYLSGENITCRCRDGYEVKSSEEVVTCGLNGTWMYPMPSCTKVKCPDLKDPQFGKLVSGSNFQFDNVAVFTCDPGWTMVGDASMRCREDGTWNASEPICVGTECPTLRPVRHSFADPKRSTAYGATVVYSCLPGYILIGNAKVTCRIDNTWSAETPECVPVECSKLKTIKNGECIADSKYFGDKAICECRKGYRNLGMSVLFCTANGNWSQPDPACQRVSCPLPDVLVEGEVVVRTRPEEVDEEVVEIKIWSLVKHRGDIAIDIGTVYQEDRSDLFRYEDRVYYTCGSGYKLVGPESRTCLENGTWSEIQPRCKPLTCDPLESPLKGKVDTTGLDFRSKAFYSCDVGHRLDGSPMRECLANGVWSQEKPLCLVVECPSPRMIPHGTASSWSKTFGSVLEYTCDEGFKLIGVSARTCGENGEWSRDLGEVSNSLWPECVQITCRNLSSPLHGSVSFKSRNFNSEAHLECKSGYETEGPIVIRCMLNGNWSQSFEECTPVRCSIPSKILNGQIFGTYRSYGASVSYVCDEGYDLVGDSSRKCQANKTWSGEDVDCRPVICSELTPPQNGSLVGDQNRTFGSQVEVLCDTGFRIIGTAVLTCLANRTWSDQIPTCNIVACESVKTITNGRVLKTSVKYLSEMQFECDDRYKLNGAKSIVCTAAGNWSGDLPSCVRQFCDDPPKISDSLLPSGKYVLGKKLLVDCELGFTLSGSNRLVCEETGQWSGHNVTCSAITCKAPPRIARNGHDNRTENVVSYEVYRLARENDVYGYPGLYRYGYVVEYRCLKGYELQGSNVSRCQLNGEWSNPVAPRCVHSCPKPPEVVNANLTLLWKSHPRLAVEYDCHKGFKLFGSRLHICAERPPFWNIGGTRCERVQCARPPSLPHGSYSYPDYEPYHQWSWGSRISYHCSAGHRLVGSSDPLTCSDRGHWSGPPLPLCLPVACSTPTSLLDGDVRVAPLPPVYGSEAFYSCKEGFQLYGEISRRCEATGTWSGSEPTCRRRSCPNVTSPPHGNYSPSVTNFWTFGDVVTFECHEGFVLKGPRNLTCSNRGVWDEETPTCTASWCSGPRLPSGSVALGSNQVHSRLLVRCPPGQRVKGHLMITCLPSGRWDAQPECEGLCSSPCLHGGICVGGLSGCKCPYGYTGHACQHPICVLPCLNGGTCVEPYLCNCRNYFTGNRCQTPICQPPCQNRGICYKPNKCKCPWNYGGKFCHIRKYSKGS